MTPSPGEALIDHANVAARAKEYIAAYRRPGVLTNYDRNALEDGYDFAIAYLALAREVKGPPREPTETMVDAVANQWVAWDHEYTAHMWRAMWDAWKP